MKSIKQFVTNFKEFLLGSTFVDVAIGLLIAGAVKDVATAFTDGFVTPIILRLLGILGVNADVNQSTEIFGIQFYFGQFISALITFVIIMFVAFSILEAYAKMKERFAKEVEEEEVEIALTNEEKILLEIRDLLKETNSSSQDK